MIVEGTGTYTGLGRGSGCPSWAGRGVGIVQRDC